MGKVFPNKMDIISKKSGQRSIAAFPDVCKTPTPGGPIAIPYPQIDKLQKASQEAKKIKTEAMTVQTKTSQFKSSTGNEAGTLKGVVSQQKMGKTQFAPASPNVKFQGKPAVMHTPAMPSGASAPPGQRMAPSQTLVIVAAAVDEAITDYKQKASSPGAYTYEQAVKIQADFEQKLESLLGQLAAAAVGNPGAQAGVQKLAALARAAAKGE